MTYTQPFGGVPITLGQLITAADMNTYWNDNIVYLKAEADKHALLFDYPTEVLIQNTVAETSLWSNTLLANTFDTNKSIRIRAAFEWLVNDGSSRSCTLRVKYGGTSIITMLPTIGPSATIFTGFIEAHIRGDTSASAQDGQGMIWAALSGGATAGALFAATGTAAIDNTSNQTLALTGQLSTASANHYFILKGLKVFGPQP